MRTSSLGVSWSTRWPLNSIVPLVTSPRSARSRFEIDFSVVRLAGAVGAEQRDDPALRHLERHALQHQDHVVVDDLDVVDRQVRRGGGWLRQRRRARTWSVRVNAIGAGASGRRGASARPSPLRAERAGRRHRGRARCSAFLAAVARRDLLLRRRTWPRASSTILRTMSRSPAMNGATCLKPLPSHCWNLTMPEPSWSAQLVLIGGKRPAAPSSLSRASVMLRCSRPQRTCSGVIDLALAVLGLRVADRLDDDDAVGRRRACR